MVVEGEEVRAFATLNNDQKSAIIRAEKRDGTPVLTGSASIGPEHYEYAPSAIAGAVPALVIQPVLL